MTKIYTSTRYDKNVHRIWKDGVIVGFAMRYANNTWGATDTDDKPIAKYGRHDTPKAVVKAMNDAEASK